MVIRKNGKVTIKSSTNTASKQYIKAAEEDDDNFGIDDVDDADGIMDAIDDVAENVEDLQDAVDDIQEDDVEIAVNNNIADHYIAECDRCKGIFISAVVDSDLAIDHVTGTCPLCGRETEQYLKWIIKAANE